MNMPNSHCKHLSVARRHTLTSSEVIHPVQGWQSSRSQDCQFESRIWQQQVASQAAGPFIIKEVINPVAYRLALPPTTSRLHDVFHTSQPKICVMLQTFLVDTWQCTISSPIPLSVHPSRMPVQSRPSGTLGAEYAWLHACAYANPSSKSAIPAA